MMVRRALTLFAALAALAACGALPAPAREAPPPLFEGLGRHQRNITTSSPEAQRHSTRA